MNRIPLISSVATICLILAGCGGSDATGGGQELDPASPVSINVAETAGIPSAFLNYGVKQGFFEQQGLDVAVDTSTGGAAAVPGLINGGTQLAGSNNVSALLAASQGLPVNIVAPGSFATETDDEDFSAVLVADNSDIEGPADLEGKTIAVNTLENIGEVTISAALGKLDVDVSTIDFVEIGFPDMIPALERGQIDAAWEIEPFVAISAKSGNRPILRPYVESHPGLMVGSFLATTQYREQNPQVIEAFRAGITATAEAVAKKPEDFRDELPELANVKPEEAEAMVLPEWKADVDVGSLKLIEEQMRSQGLTNEKLDIATVVAG